MSVRACVCEYACMSACMRLCVRECVYLFTRCDTCFFLFTLESIISNPTSSSDL